MAYFSTDIGILRCEHTVSGSIRSPGCLKAAALAKACCEDENFEGKYRLGLSIADCTRILLNHWSTFLKSVAGDISLNSLNLSTVSTSTASNHSKPVEESMADSESKPNNKSDLASSSKSSKTNASNLSSLEQEEKAVVGSRAEAIKQDQGSEIIKQSSSVSPISWIQADGEVLPVLLGILTTLMSVETLLVESNANTDTTSPIPERHANFVWYMFGNDIARKIATVIRSSHIIARSVSEDPYCHSVLVQLTNFISTVSIYVKKCAGFDPTKPINTVAQLTPRKFGKDSKGKEILSLLRGSDMVSALLALLESAAQGDYRRMSVSKLAMMAGLVRGMVSIASVDVNLIQRITANQQISLVLATGTLLKAEVKEICNPSRFPKSISRFAYDTNSKDENDDEHYHPISQLLALIGYACIRNCEMQKCVASPIDRDSHSVVKLSDFTNYNSSSVQAPLIVEICR